LGYDSIIYGHTIDADYQNKMLDNFIKQIILRGINYERIKIITFSLVMGVFHSLKSHKIKQNVWEWIIKCRSENRL